MKQSVTDTTQIKGRQDILIVPRIICAAIALGKSLFGLGSSSAIWVIASGVPIAKAPFKTPAKNATPSDHPVEFCQSVHTKLLEACCEGIAATTTIVTRPPTSTRKSPRSCRYGMMRLPKMTTATQNHKIKR